MDLTPILTALSALGPWGVVAGIGITLLAQFLRNRLVGPARPVRPAPSPTPAMLDDRFPLLQQLVAALGLGSRRRPATAADLPHELILQLRGEVERLSAAAAAAHATALRDLSAGRE